jgi:hypothetical protein
VLIALYYDAFWAKNSIITPNERKYFAYYLYGFQLLSVLEVKKIEENQFILATDCKGSRLLNVGLHD